MIVPTSDSPRPFSASEQSLADKFRAQLTPEAAHWQAGADHARTCSQSRPIPRSPKAAREAKQRQRDDRRRYREAAKQALYQQAARHSPACGLGVVELFILKWVVSQLLNWIMSQWLGEGDDDVDQDD